MKLLSLLSLALGLCAFPALAQAPLTLSGGDISFAAGKFAEARQAYTAAEKANPDDIAPRLGLIRTLLRLDLWPEARAEAQSAALKFPASADAHGLLALTLIRAGWQEPYAQEAAQALTLDPKNYWGLLAYARSAEWDSRTVAARGLYRQASVVHPEWPEAWLGLLQTLSAKTDKEERDKVAQTYRKLAPTGQPHDRMRERLAEQEGNEAAYKEGFGSGPLFERIPPKAGSAETGPVVLPFEHVGNYTAILVTVNSVPFRLIFDTGAGGKLTLTKTASARLPRKVVAHSYTRGVGGREDSDISRGETMTLGSRIYRSVLIGTVGDIPGIADGLFGGSILRDSVVTLDFAASTLTLASGSKAAAPPPSSGSKVLTLPFHFIGGHLYLPLTVHAHSLWALVDTGAALSHFSLREAQGKLKDVPKAQVHSGTVKRRIGIGVSTAPLDYLASRTPATVMLTSTPPFPLSLPTVGLSELDREVSPGMEFEIGLLLGMSTLTQAKRITFDYPHRLLTWEYVAQ